MEDRLVSLDEGGKHVAFIVHTALFVDGELHDGKDVRDDVPCVLQSYGKTALACLCGKELDKADRILRGKVEAVGVLLDNNGYQRAIHLVVIDDAGEGGRAYETINIVRINSIATDLAG